MKPDIKSQEDIELLIHNFYRKLVVKSEMQPFFQSTDLESHLPRMIAFWCFLLLDKPGYKTNVTQFHEHMPFQEAHMTIWLNLFHETIDSLFNGQKATFAKERASLLGYTMLAKKR